MPKSYILIFSLLIALLVKNPIAQAKEEVKEIINKRACALTRILDKDEIKEHAGIIFSGKYLNSELIEAEAPLQRIAFKFSVTEPIKGLSSMTKELTIYQWANLEDHFSKLDKDKIYTFHFYSPSPNSGLSSLVGGKQGITELK